MVQHKGENCRCYIWCCILAGGFQPLIENRVESKQTRFTDQFAEQRRAAGKRIDASATATLLPVSTVTVVRAVFFAVQWIVAHAIGARRNLGTSAFFNIYNASSLHHRLKEKPHPCSSRERPDATCDSPGFGKHQICCITFFQNWQQEMTTSHVATLKRNKKCRSLL